MKGAVRDSKGTWGEVCEGIEGRRFGVDKREREMCWISERDMRGGGDGGARVEGGGSCLLMTCLVPLLFVLERAVNQGSLGVCGQQLSTPHAAMTA